MKKKKEKFICTLCGKPYEYQCSVTYIDGKATCLHDGDAVIAEKGVAEKKKRHLNEIMSVDARRQADAQIAQDRETGANKEITVTSTQGRSAGRTEKIKESVVESIKEKTQAQVEHLLQD